MFPSGTDGRAIALVGYPAVKQSRGQSATAVFAARGLAAVDKLGDVYYTHKHGSWLNMAEIELSVLSRQCLNRRIPNQEILKAEIAAWERTRNQEQATVSWRFTNDNDRVKLPSLYSKLSPNDDIENTRQPICDCAIACAGGHQN